MANVHELLDTWLAGVTDSELHAELEQMKQSGDEAAITDAFFQDLEFGTAGLRGTIGAGTNRMNIYTVGRATQGFADYLVKNFENPTVAIARDSRNKGELFVKTTAAILAANGVTSYVYPKISPVPTLSWAVRYLHCSGGICMTASHNPAPYNGYKAYGPDGCQITSEAAEAISAAMQATDPFADIKTMDFDAAVEQGLVKWVDDSVLDAYYDAVLAQSVNNLTPEQIGRRPAQAGVHAAQRHRPDPGHHGAGARGHHGYHGGPRAARAQRRFPHLPVSQPRDSRGHAKGHRPM